MAAATTLSKMILTFKLVSKEWRHRSHRPTSFLAMTILDLSPAKKVGAKTVEKALARTWLEWSISGAGIQPAQIPKVRSGG